jgi:ABC-type phosphate/phosphonate transport system substrate-binding protein
MKWWLLACLVFFLTGSVSRAAEPELFNMGFYLPGVRDVPRADVLVTLQLWADEIGKIYGYQAKPLLYENMTDLHRDMVSGKLNIAVAPGMEMAETFRMDELAEGFIGRHNHADEGLALVAADPALRKFADLRGKRVVRLSNDRLSEIFLEVECRNQMGGPCRDQFSVSEEKRDAQLVYKVFFGHADAALVKLSTLQAVEEMNPQIAKRLHVLLDWKVKSISFGMMNPRNPPGFRGRLLSAALLASKQVRVKQILELFKTDYMERTMPADLEPYWRLHDEYQSLTNRKSTR